MLEQILRDHSSALWLFLLAMAAGVVGALLLRQTRLLRQQQRSHDHMVRLETRLADQFDLMRDLDQRSADLRQSTAEEGLRLREALRAILAEQQTRSLQQSARVQQEAQTQLRGGIAEVQRQVLDALERNAGTIAQQVEALTRVTDRRLATIAGQVEQRLTEGFDKTAATFTEVVRRLSLIDAAQQKIAELSANVVSLQDILLDKRSRGVLGETQLAALIRNVLPEAHFSLQHRLSNGRIVDCLLLLPEPSGRIAVDAKFPLESYRAMHDADADPYRRSTARRQFRQDVRKHIQDIAARYLVPGETADGAILFIPAEAVFAEIQAHHPELVEFAHRARVWLVSPTTLWAVLNTARAILKDVALREQIGVIRGHLVELAADFDRFRQRMDALTRHIAQAHQDVQEVNTSARRISSRFERIERADLEQEDRAARQPLDKID
ncbi:MAG: DNA recombination protein RmuC [Gammaproteobacteria bacterium]|nr:DNA recombination protein RmuC [Gammaproteobacteria bacterium]